jgi:hypothetical protein
MLARNADKKTKAKIIRAIDGIALKFRQIYEADLVHIESNVAKVAQYILS